MAEWRRIKVADIGNVVTGKTPKTNNSDYYGGKMPFLTPSDDMSVKYVRDTKKHLTEAGKMSVKNAVIPENSICVSCIGSDLGKVVITTEETVTNQQINSIIVNGSQFDINYIYYSMVELGKILNFHSKTSTAVPIVNKSSFSQYEIICPDLYIQRKIGDVLSKLDEKIEENIKINNNLLQQIQLLCRSWLVDYAPFGYEQPATWSVVPLSLIADFVSGYSYKGAELADSDIAMATIKNFDRKGGFKLDGYKEIQPSAKLKPEQHAQLFDTLVAHTDLTQNAEVIGNAEPILSMSGYNDIVFSMDVVKVLPKEGVSRFLIAALLQDGRFKAHALGYVNGTTVLHLSKKALPEFELLLPPDLEELAPLANAVEAIYRKIADNIDESTHLANLRNTLLPRLMSGELDVLNIDL